MTALQQSTDDLLLQKTVQSAHHERVESKLLQLEHSRRTEVFRCKDLIACVSRKQDELDDLRRDSQHHTKKLEALQLTCGAHQSVVVMETSTAEKLRSSLTTTNNHLTGFADEYITMTQSLKAHNEYCALERDFAHSVEQLSGALLARHNTQCFAKLHCDVKERVLPRLRTSYVTMQGQMDEVVDKKRSLEAQIISLQQKKESLDKRTSELSHSISQVVCKTNEYNDAKAQSISQYEAGKEGRMNGMTTTTTPLLSSSLPDVEEQLIELNLTVRDTLRATIAERDAGNIKERALALELAGVTEEVHVLEADCAQQAKKLETVSKEVQQKKVCLQQHAHELAYVFHTAGGEALIPYHETEASITQVQTALDEQLEMEAQHDRDRLVRVEKVKLAKIQSRNAEAKDALFAHEVIVRQQIETDAKSIFTNITAACHAVIRMFSSMTEAHGKIVLDEERVFKLITDRCLADFDDVVERGIQSARLLHFIEEEERKEAADAAAAQQQQHEVVLATPIQTPHRRQTQQLRRPVAEHLPRREDASAAAKRTRDDEDKDDPEGVLKTKTSRRRTQQQQQQPQQQQQTDIVTSHRLAIDDDDDDDEDVTIGALLSQRQVNNNKSSKRDNGNDHNISKLSGNTMPPPVPVRKTQVISRIGQQQPQQSQRSTIVPPATPNTASKAVTRNKGNKKQSEPPQPQQQQQQRVSLKHSSKKTKRDVTKADEAEDNSMRCPSPFSQQQQRNNNHGLPTGGAPPTRQMQPVPNVENSSNGRRTTAAASMLPPPSHQSQFSSSPMSLVQNGGATKKTAQPPGTTGSSNSTDDNLLIMSAASPAPRRPPQYSQRLQCDRTGTKKPNTNNNGTQQEGGGGGGKGALGAVFATPRRRDTAVVPPTPASSSGAGRGGGRVTVHHNAGRAAQQQQVVRLHNTNTGSTRKIPRFPIMSFDGFDDDDAEDVFAM